MMSDIIKDEEELDPMKGLHGEKVQSAIDAYDRDYKLLYDNYTSGVSALDKSKQASAEMAAVTRERLMRYLPQQMRSQGVYTQGVSEDAAIKIANNYQNTMSEIAANYDKNKSALDSDFTEKSNALADARDNAIIGAKEELAVYEKAEEDKLEAEEKAAADELTNNYNTLFEAADTGAYTYDQMYALAIRNGHDEETAKTLAGYAGTAYDEIAAEKTEAKKGELTKNYLSIMSMASSGVYDDEVLKGMLQEAGITDEAYITNVLSTAKTARNALQSNNNGELTSMYLETLLGMTEAAVNDTDGMTESEYEDLLKFVNDRADKIGPDNSNLLLAYLEGYKPQTREEKAAVVAASPTTVGSKAGEIHTDISLTQDHSHSNSGEGDDFRISIDADKERVYSIEKGPTASSELASVLSGIYSDNTGKKPDIGAIMIYDGHLFIYQDVSENGTNYTWSLVRGRRGGVQADDWTELCQKLGLNESEYDDDYGKTWTAPKEETVDNTEEITSPSETPKKNANEVDERKKDAEDKARELLKKQRTSRKGRGYIDGIYLALGPYYSDSEIESFIKTGNFGG